ncbi:hypothetical protein IB256_09840 [Pseudomonas sp. PDM17]|uniref:hypothetical protein n=1 Tax=Pseudomonas sp. PDM17 TaxID=2769285 RepID=UPI00178618E4|nr:hypothetical protein [Pseudomonas sp. PDM17]MBD9501079.1 hypothetical protein [Pseudomonas sp. PDM17]
MKKNRKKKRNKDKNMLPRKTWIYGSSAGEVSSLTIQLDPATNQLNILEIHPSTIRRQITHKRDGKDDKILYSAPVTDFSLLSTDFSELQQRFHYLMAVDTNTLNEIHQGYRVSACCIYVVKEPLQVLSSEIPYQHHASYLILNSDHQAKSEPIGWHLAITRSIPGDFIQSNRIGMIVDSELGKHVDINAHKEPYYETTYLPPTMQLIYASSDKSATFANDMIRNCDSGAKMLLNEFQKHGIAEVLEHKPIRIGTALCFPVKTLDLRRLPANTATH